MTPESKGMLVTSENYVCTMHEKTAKGHQVCIGTNDGHVAEQPRWKQLHLPIAWSQIQGFGVGFWFLLRLIYFILPRRDLQEPKGAARPWRSLGGHSTGCPQHRVFQHRVFQHGVSPAWGQRGHHPPVTPLTSWLRRLFPEQT